MRGRVIAMQARVCPIAEAYCDRVHSQLESQEKKKKKKKGKGKGNKGDGWPPLLTGDEFFNQVVWAEETHEKEAAERGSEMNMSKPWRKTQEEARKARNEAKPGKARGVEANCDRLGNPSQSTRQEVDLREAAATKGKCPTFILSAPTHQNHKETALKIINGP